MRKHNIMGRWIVLSLCMFCLMLAAAGHISADTTAPPKVKATYKIGCGDVLRISVWKEPDLSAMVVVLPDGTIHYPLVGQLVALDKTVDDLQEQITLQLKKFMPEGATVDVSVDKVNSLCIYVVGKVNNPGMFPLSEHITVMQALSMARGLTPFADQRKIKIFRNTATERKTFEFDYKDVVKGKHPEQNIEMERGDLIVVP